MPFVSDLRPARLIFATLLLLGVPSLSLAGPECQRAYFGDLKENSFACKCSENHCDRLQPIDWPEEGGAFVRVESNLAGARFEQSQLKISPINEKQEEEKEEVVDFVIEMRANRHRQQVTGFGGSLTDSAAMVVMGLSPKLQQSLLDDYFSEFGLDYNLGRIPIGGSDMSVRAYSYDDQMPAGIEEDFELKYFELQREDLHFKVPLIRRINVMRAQRNLEPVKLLAATWSPPAWMKNNSNLVQGALKGNHQGAYYNASARYLMRFLDEYELNQKVPIWAITAQNEPYTPTRLGRQRINFNSVNFSPEEMADYLEFSLIPTMIEANRTKRQKLFFYDDGLDGLHRYCQVAMQRAKVREHLSGVAIHWYAQALAKVPYSDLYAARRNLSAHLSMMSTEACYQGGPKPGDWQRAVGYARDLITNLDAGSTAWIDWNLALNTSGGPTWVGNVLDAAILVDTGGQTYYKNPMFYSLAHVTRFVAPGSTIVATTVARVGRTKRGRRQQDQRGPEKKEEEEEQGEDKMLDVVAAELGVPHKDSKEIGRRFSVVALNRADERRRVKLKLVECKLNSTPLELELASQSLTSLAFIC